MKNSLTDLIALLAKTHKQHAERKLLSNYDMQYLSQAVNRTILSCLARELGPEELNRILSSLNPSNTDKSD